MVTKRGKTGKKKAAPKNARSASAVRQLAPRVKWNAHLSFNGDCEEAFELYEKCLGGKIAYLLTYGETPMARQTPASFHGKVLHGTLTAGALTLTGADVLPDQYRKPQGFQVLLHVGSPSDADRIFEAFADGGVVQLPIQETFWAKRFGMVVDRFGTPWLVQCST